MPIDGIEGVIMSSQDMRMIPEPTCEYSSSGYDGGLNPLCFRQGTRPVPTIRGAKMRSHGVPVAVVSVIGRDQIAIGLLHRGVPSQSVERWAAVCVARASGFYGA